MSAAFRHLLIAGGVLLLHAGALWALQSGLLRRAVETVIPVALVSEWIEPARPKVEAPPAPPALPKPARALRPVAPPQASPLPQPIPVSEPEPTPEAPAAIVTPPVPHPPIGEPVVPVARPAEPSEAAPAPPKVELPSTDADYLHNPKPPYPALSRRLGEQGRVVVRVLIGVDGRALKAEIAQSSGYERLDQTALQTVLRWRYVPGRRGGVPEAMWFNVPIHFVLE